MRIREFILIVVMKMFAIMVITVGILCEARGGASWGYLLISMGSLVFAIASNTTLFVYTSIARKRRKEKRHHEPTHAKSFDCRAATGPFAINTGGKSGACFAVRFARKEGCGN